MSALSLKLRRSIWRMKGQMLTIALVVACGIAAFLSLKGDYQLLYEARSSYYDRYRFGDVFASLERAPETLTDELRTIDSVAQVQTRIRKAATLRVEGMTEPVRAQLVSLDEAGSSLNALLLRKGRLPRAGDDREVVVLEPFAEAHTLALGDALEVVQNGRLRQLRIVGMALSPEYIMAMPPGDMSPDPKRFAVLWLDRRALAASFAMQGAFNDVSLRLQPQARLPEVLRQLDDLLRPYGGVGAIGRAKQSSHYMIEGELQQLQSMSSVMPVLFLAVAALLLNVVLSRLVQLQRGQIAVLKALGYSDLRIGLHYLALVCVVALFGAAIGVLLGAWLGKALLGLYIHYFKFPNLVYRLPWRSAVTALLVSALAAAAGAFSAVRQVMALPPAEAMRPAAPARYGRSLLDYIGLAKLAGPVGQMIVRELTRRPLRSLLSSAAISVSVGLNVVGAWYYDGLDTLIYTQFHEVMREDVALTFLTPTPERAVRELRQFPGVRHAEGLRIVPVRFHGGHRVRDGSVIGYPAHGQLRSLRDMYGRPSPLPPDGVVLTDMLAEILDVEVGDQVEIELHDGRRGRRSVKVAGLVAESFGLQGHMQLDALRRWRGESQVVSMALLRTDPAYDAELEEALKSLPGVLSMTRRSHILARFKEQSAGMILTFTLIITLFAATITVGVVYNNARVALSLRARDLASLRVLGFQRSEISTILLGELAIQVLVALPMGMVLGYLMVLGLTSTIDPETYRLPIVLSTRTYAFATAIVVAASALSALLVRRRLDKLDLIAVLKTRQ